MKKLLTVVLFGLLGATAGRAFTPYIGGGIGYWLDSEDAIYNARIGVDFASTDALTQSVEGELFYGRDKDGGAKMDLTGFMANYRVTVPAGAKFYVGAGAGLGVTRVKLDWLWVDDSDAAFTFQLLGTVGYKLNPRLSLEGTVRYLNIGEARIGGIKADVGSDTSLEIGLKYRF